MSITRLRLQVSTYVGEGIEQTCTVRDLTEHDFTATQLAALEHILVRAGQDPAPPTAAFKGRLPGEPPVLVTGDRVRQVADERSRAVQSGYLGEACDNCNMFMLKRTGKCTSCDNCGATGGCG